jgi:radical SAM-linked protein
MDSWYDGLDQAFAAWENAIAEAGLDWKYRQIENGEWNLMEGVSGDLRLDAPLPWDHIDSGIDKNWLKEDLQLALQAATVPDCSFDSCSHCGVCGTDFGSNVVMTPPTIPEFAGDFVPNTTKVQRLRVKFGKLGDMALVGHLDLMRLFDRIIRRSGLPVAFSGGFHPSPRIAIANALPLGATSSGEIVDFELTQIIPAEVFQEKLIQTLPSNIPIYEVAEVDIKAPAATQILNNAEYLITIAANTDVTAKEWQTWVDTIKSTSEIWLDHTTKSGKQQLVNLCDRLFEIELMSTNINAKLSTAVCRYIGSCRHDGTQLRPEQILFMLEQVAARELEFHLLHVHRNQLFLGT